VSLWSVYMVRGKDNSLYTGVAQDVAKRFAQHQAQGAQCAKYLKGRAPLVLVYEEVVGNKSQALKREYALKQLPKAAKELMTLG
jgi:putative endonuclease